MNNIQILSHIAGQLKAINEHTETLITANLPVSALDKELLKKMCVDVYENISILKINYSAQDLPTLTPTVNPVHSLEEFERLELEQISKTVIDVPLQKTEIMETMTNLTEPLTQNEKKETFTYVERKDNLINITKDETLHEKISVSKQSDLKEKFNETKVDNLKTAIGLNKKIAFVNDLFKENTVEYAKAIEKLNSSTDLNEALHYFNDLKHHYSWANDNDLVVELEQLVQKRFR